MAYKNFSTKATPQRERARSDQVVNSEDGYVFGVGKWGALDRFLILGTEGGTYYVGATELTKQNAQQVISCIHEDGPEVVRRIVNVSDSGRAAKNTPALFALALCMGDSNITTRKAAYDALPKVARTGYHQEMLAAYVDNVAGTGRGWRKAQDKWFNSKSADQLAYQAIKYQQREGWGLIDILRLAHVQPIDGLHDLVFKYITKGWQKEWGDVREQNDFLDIADQIAVPNLIWAFEKAKTVDHPRDIAHLIYEHNLPREAIPTQFLNDIGVWEALLYKMPVTAMIRNLGKMTSIGLIKPMSGASTKIVETLTSEDALAKARIHPMNVLFAMKTYSMGHGFRGHLSWNPVREVVDALDRAFYMSFGNVQPTNKRLMLALDVSGSMSYQIDNSNVECREAAAAMSLVTANVEPRYMMVGFTTGGSSYDWRSNTKLIELDISPRQRLDDVVRYMIKVPYGGTDCALPMVYAIKNELEIDAFVIYTDSETWHGRIQPFQALREYRKKSGIDAKLVVVGMVSNGFSIADPNDPGMLDVVGFDTSTPNVISNFVI